MSRPGDWNCRGCNHLNFQRRESCQRCGEPRIGGGGGGIFGGGRLGGGGGGSSSSSPFSFMSSTGPDVRPGDWYCTLGGGGNCGAHNFASRSSCFKCGAPKEDYSSSSAEMISSTTTTTRPFSNFGSTTRPAGWKSGDWICTRSGCNEHNFANRMECYRCNAPREYSSTAATANARFAGV